MMSLAPTLLLSTQKIFQGCVSSFPWHIYPSSYLLPPLETPRWFWKHPRYLGPPSGLSLHFSPPLSSFSNLTSPCSAIPKCCVFSLLHLSPLSSLLHQKPLLRCSTSLVCHPLQLCPHFYSSAPAHLMQAIQTHTTHQHPSRLHSSLPSLLATFAF